MNDIIFASDLDNTLIFSHKHCKEDDICVEILDGKKQGFCRKELASMLEKIAKKALFVPITTRSMAQYHRIRWDNSCVPQYALTTNGAILLINGKIDAVWYAESKKLAATCKSALQNIAIRLKTIEEVKRFRMVDEMYLFAACDNEEDAKKSKQYFSGNTGVDVQVSGRKLYFFPCGINKGEAIKRLRKRFASAYIISAGDSEIDVPMLMEADFSIFIGRFPIEKQNITEFCEDDIREYTQFVLKTVLHKIDAVKF